MAETEKVYYPTTRKLQGCELPTEWKMLIRDRNIGNRDALADEKHVAVEPHVPISAGVAFEWRDAWWFIMDHEHKLLQGNHEMMARKLNARLKWRVNGGRICTFGDGLEGQPVFVRYSTRQVSRASGSDMQLGKWVDSGADFIMQDNEDSRAIKRGARIGISDKAYEIIQIDNVSHDGLLILTAEETGVNTALDVEVNGTLVVGNKRTELEVEDDTMISGERSVTLGGTYEYTARHSGEWTVTDASSVLKIISQTNTRLTVEVPNNFASVGRLATIKFTTSFGTENSIDVRPIAPFGGRRDGQ
jgi:hypothetical protein